MNNVFAYGTLLNPELRQRVLQRDVPSVMATLFDVYRTEENGYYNLMFHPDGSTQGEIFSVSDEELVALDQWESFYRRIKMFTSRGEAWVYLLRSHPYFLDKE
jgi:gamma-glutamylcyclotransferase (GGCT)/AIG2-like uncharacterized protein YtfP